MDRTGWAGPQPEAGIGRDTPACLLLEDVPAAVLVFDNGILRAANTAARALLQLDAGASLAELGLVLDPQRSLGGHLRAAIQEGSTSRLRFDSHLGNGAPLSLQLHITPSGTHPGQVVVLAYDDRPHQEIERQLQRRLQFERLLTETSAALIRSTSAELDDTIVDMLGSIGAFFGVDRAYVFLINDASETQSNTHEWVSPGISREADNLQDVPLTTFPWLLEQLRADHVFRVERVADLPPQAINERKEFEREGIQSILIVPLWLGPHLHGFVGFDAVRSQLEWGEHYVIGLRLMAQMLASALDARMLSMRLQEQAFHDVLTGLPNRKLLEDRFEQASHRTHRNGGSMVVAVVDIDNFKQVNDQHGHPVGDALLCEVGERLQVAIRDSDTVARLGGDEFVVLADCGGAGCLAHLADRLVATCASPLQVDGQTLQVGLSIGLVHGLPGQDSLDGLIRQADAAMYRAKAEGKNRWVEAPVATSERRHVQ